MVTAALPARRATDAPPLAAAVTLLCASVPGVSVTVAHGYIYVTGPALGAAATLLGADSRWLVTRCYTGRELALVILPALVEVYPPLPSRRPVCPPVSDDPNERDLWGTVLAARAYDGPERRARQRAAQDDWFTWCVRGTTGVNWGES